MSVHLVTVTYAVESSTEDAARAIVCAIATNTLAVTGCNLHRWTSIESVKLCTPETEETYEWDNKPGR